MRSASGERRQLRDRSDAGTVGDSFRRQEQLGRRRSSLRSSSEIGLKVESVTGQRRTWREMKREGIGGLKSEQRRTGRRYSRALKEWWKPRAFSELFSTPLVVHL